jgi:membrane associated rhomboid family serine protease
MNVWLMTNPMFWITLGAWSGFCVGLFAGALMTWWYRDRGVKRRNLISVTALAASPH